MNDIWTTAILLLYPPRIEYIMKRVTISIFYAYDRFHMALFKTWELLESLYCCQLLTINSILSSVTYKSRDHVKENFIDYHSVSLWPYFSRRYVPFRKKRCFLLHAKKQNTYQVIYKTVCESIYETGTKIMVLISWKIELKNKKRWNFCSTLKRNLTWW